MFRCLALGLGVVLALTIGELFARYRVQYVWSAEMRHTMLADGSTSGRYIFHDVMGYMPRPNYDDHNSLGFRGQEFQLDKRTELFRIVCLGGSTTYGPSAATAYPAVLEKLLREEGVEVEVVNSGVPGWTSRETLLNFQLRVAPLAPDLVVIYHGRNDLIPQAYNDFQNDYSHFRNPEFDFREVSIARASLKRWFRISHLFMLATRAAPQISHFDEAAEHPIFAAVRVENRPSPEQAAANLAEGNRTAAFRSNTEEVIRSALDSGAHVLLATFAFRSEKLKESHFLAADPVMERPLNDQLDRNNEELRGLARQYNLLLAETAVLADHPELFNDDCHVDTQGHMMRARAILETLRQGKAFSRGSDAADARQESSAESL